MQPCTQVNPYFAILDHHFVAVGIFFLFFGMGVVVPIVRHIFVGTSVKFDSDTFIHSDNGLSDVCAKKVQ